jgi:hypothetical protein
MNTPHNNQNDEPAINQNDDLVYAGFITDSRSFFAEELGLPKQGRGRRSNIDDEKNSETEVRLLLNRKQERIFKALQREHNLAVAAIARRFMTEGIRSWTYRGRDKFDLSYKVKKTYGEAIRESVQPIANQVAMLNNKIDSFADEMTHNFETVLIQSEAITPGAGLSDAEGMNKAAPMLLKLARETLAQNELLISMIGSILKMTPRFQTGTGNDAKIDTAALKKFLDEGRKQAQTDADELIVEMVNDKGED